MDCRMPGLPVPLHLSEFAQVHVHWISDAIQSSHPLLPSSPSALNSSQRQGLFQWAGDFCTKEDSSLKKIFLAASGCIDSLVVLCRLSSCVVRAQLLLSMWDFSSLTRDWTHISWIAMQILNHWTTREVPKEDSSDWKSSIFFQKKTFSSGNQKTMSMRHDWIQVFTRGGL